jgi:hypothetical protein
VIRWGTDDGWCLVIVVVLLPVCCKNLRGTVLLIPEKNVFEQNDMNPRKKLFFEQNFEQNFFMFSNKMTRIRRKPFVPALLRRVRVCRPAAFCHEGEGRSDLRVRFKTCPLLSRGGWAHSLLRRRLIFQTMLHLYIHY